MCGVCAGDITRKLFDEAQLEIYMMLANDTYSYLCVVLFCLVLFCFVALSSVVCLFGCLLFGCLFVQFCALEARPGV